MTYKVNSPLPFGRSAASSTASSMTARGQSRSMCSGRRWSPVPATSAPTDALTPTCRVPSTLAATRTDPNSKRAAPAPLPDLLADSVVHSGSGERGTRTEPRGDKRRASESASTQTTHTSNAGADNLAAFSGKGWN